ncbi:MAG: hypothetical protein LAO51_10320 [Acidobacteriia bacterium]|nr:hypothetical protein [Terriglobia bacterium]
MAKAGPDSGPRRRGALGAGLLALGSAFTCALAVPTDIVSTKHNLSVSGTGQVRALTENRICIFCHTPHNAMPLSPLWNKEIEPQVYTVYVSPSLRAGPLPQPSGPSKLCLSCHDGTIAMGAVVNPAGGIVMAGGDRLSPGSLSNFGLDLSGHHPVSFPYHTALPNAELSATPPPDLTYGGSDEVHCVTCHDPHSDAYGDFLVKDNRYSSLCTTCHQMTGWNGSAHATSTASVAGILPRPPKTWPTYTQLGEWGCETCHTPHFAPTAEDLLNFTSAPPEPFSCTSAGCHSSEPPPPHAASGIAGAALRPPGGMADIARQVRKPSAHHMPEGVFTAAARIPGGAARTGVRGVACADCHNPHSVTGAKGQAPYASGLLQGVSGIDRNGAAVRAATYEYEICFKCHSESSADLEYVPRVVGGTNTRLAFDLSNPSYHPVVGMGRNLDVPSIPSSITPTMSATEVIYCSTCHADDEGGSNGPHGSSFRPILRERYETTDNTKEGYESYALCYRCHERASILGDASFRKRAGRRTGSGGGHSGHLAAGIPCSACHDPHGVSGAEGSGTGSHTHLINFDTRIVLKNTKAYPVFNDTGALSGGCDLVCHGKVHDDASTSYP